MTISKSDISLQAGDSYRCYYSLIQYRPDPARMEAINQGVLLFCPERGFLRCRTTTSTRRLESTFGRGTFDPDQVRFALQSIEDRLQVDSSQFKTVDDLRKFVDSRAGQIILTQPRPASVDSPEDYLEKIYHELIGKYPVRSDGDANFGRQVAEALGPAIREGKLKRRYRVEIKSGIEREFPYAYRNGAMNCIRPIRFAADVQKSADAALRCGGEAVEIGRMKEPAKLIVISGFGEGENQEAARRAADEILADFDVRVVPTSEIATFVASVVREGHA